MKLAQVLSWILACALTISAFAVRQHMGTKQRGMPKLTILCKSERNPGLLLSLDLQNSRVTTLVDGKEPVHSINYSAALHRAFFVINKPQEEILESIKPDGTDVHEICRLERDAKPVSICEDGTRLVYLRQSHAKPDGKFRELIKLDIRTGNLSLVYRVGPHSVIGDANISPDGRQVAFWQDDGAHEKIYSCVLDSLSKPKRIIIYPGHQRLPKWSFNQKSILFWSDHVEQEGLTWVECDLNGQVIGESTSPLKPGALGFWVGQNQILQCEPQPAGHPPDLTLIQGSEIIGAARSPDLDLRFEVVISRRRSM